MNATVGDLAGNVSRIVDFAKRARAGGADVMITPELAVCGYPPEDLLLREDFVVRCAEAVDEIAQRVRGITLVVGHPRLEQSLRYNSASVLRDGEIVCAYDKHNLPNYTVFDEERYFEPSQRAGVFTLDGVRFGLNICADTWEAGAPRRALEAGAQCLLVLNASPYHVRKREMREQVMRARVAETRIPLVYANMVGGQDELVFDGASFAMNSSGDITHELPAFEEALGFVDIVDGEPAAGTLQPPVEPEADVYRALVLGVRDYVGKNDFPGVILGLSGGIDSALTLAVAADALGPGKVHAVMMPSRYTAAISLEDARAQARTLGVRYSEISIDPLFDAHLTALTPAFEGLARDTTEENLQSRTRGTLLMALSNKSGAIVLTTGNKSEMATGYATLYGDMAGGFSVLKDIGKGLVYTLARYRNSVGQVIPERVIDRPPSAELKAGQTDADSLPPYPVLDAILEAYIEDDLTPAEIIAQGHSRAQVEDVVRMLRLSEYKRRQAPIGIRVTTRAFGKDWRYPITNRFRHRYEP